MLLVQYNILCVLLLVFAYDLVVSSSLEADSELSNVGEDTSELSDRSKRAIDVHLLLRNIFLKSASFSELKSNLSKSTTRAPMRTTTTTKPRTTKKTVQFYHPLFQLSNYKKGFIQFDPNEMQTTENSKPSRRPKPKPTPTRKPKPSKKPNIPPQGLQHPKQLIYQQGIPGQYFVSQGLQDPPGPAVYSPAPFGDFYVQQGVSHAFQPQQPSKGISFAYTQPSDFSYDDPYSYKGNFRRPNYDYDFARTNPNTYADENNNNDNGNDGGKDDSENNGAEEGGNGNGGDSEDDESDNNGNGDDAEGDDDTNNGNDGDNNDDNGNNDDEAEEGDADSASTYESRSYYY